MVAMLLSWQLSMKWGPKRFSEFSTLKALFSNVLTLKNLSCMSLHAISQAHSQGGAVAPPQKKCQKKRGKGREREKKENKVACMHVKLLPFNHFQSKIKYKFVLYKENTGHMHQIAPLTTSKCKKLSLWTPLPHPPPLARSVSVASLPRTLFLPPPLKLNPGFATAISVFDKVYK